MTQNRLFQPRDLDLLGDARPWPLIIAGNQHPVTDSAQHRRWMAHHSHQHAHAELLFVLDGQSELGLENHVHKLERGSVCFFSAGHRHDEGYRTGGLLRHLWIAVLARHYIAQVIERPAGRRYRQVWREVLSVDQAGVLPAVFSRSNSNDARHTQVIQAAALILVSNLVKCGYQPNADSAADLQREVVTATCQHIERTAGRGLTLTDLARIAGYSKFHFLRLFRSHTGLTVHQFIDRCRLARFQELSAANWSQRYIAEHLGFSHPAALSRWKRQLRQPHVK